MRLKNMAANDALQKALLDTTAASTGDVLIPEIVEPVIRRYIETETPLFNLSNPKDHPTVLYKYKLMNGLPNAYFAAEGGALPAPERPNFERRSAEMKYIYIRGEVTGPEIAATRSVEGAYEISLEASGLGLAQTLEEKILTGDSSVNPLEFDGYLKQVTNTFTPAGGGVGTEVATSLALMNEAGDSGQADVVIMSKAMSRRVWGLLQAQQRFVNESDIDGGFRVISYNGTPIYRVLTDFANAALENTILMLNRRFLVLPIMQDVTYEELAKTRDSRDYMLKMYLTLAVEGAEGKHHVKVQYVKSTP